MDSDSDNSIVAPSGNRAVIDDVDSDSDDSLLAKEAIFSRKRKKSQESSKSKADRILDDALESCQRSLEQQRRIGQIKREELDEDDLVANARLLQQQSAKKPKSWQAARAIVEGTELVSVGEGVHDRERLLALAEAADTQNTSSLGSRSMISSKKTSQLPSTSCQTLEYLQNVLDETANRLAPEIRDVLITNLRKGTLHSFLLNKQLCTIDQIGSLPKPLLHWFLIVASTSSGDDARGTELAESLACGAYLTLSRMWVDFKAFPDQGFILSLSDMPIQLQEWFGLCGRAGNNPQEPHDIHQCTRTEVAIVRFLHLWDLAFTRKMVHFDIDVLDHATKCIIDLLLTGLDQVFESNKTRSNDAMPFLYKLLAHVLETAASACGENLNKHKTWMESLVDNIFEALSQLGPGAPGAEDADDTQAWLCHSRSIRMILSSAHAGGPNHSSELSVHLSARVIKGALELTDWNADVLSILKQWNLPQRLLDSSRWQAMASSYLALSKLSSRFPNEGGPKSLAVVEISHLCLQAAMSMFGRYLEHQQESNNEFAHLMDGSRQENAEESDCIYLAFEQLEEQSSNIAGKSNSLVMSDPHFLRVNYHVNCIRQYPRLEKHSFRSHPTVAMQATLDSWISSDK